MGFAQELRAKARAADQGKAKPQKSQAKARPPRPRARISAHPAFAPLLGAWGAIAAGLSVMVLPPQLVAGLAGVLVPSFAAGFATPIAALAAALVIGLMCYAAAQLVSRRGRRGTPAVHPIDPASELGSDSFDAPLPEDLMAEDADWEEIDGDWLADDEDGGEEHASQIEDDLPVPDLSLEEFGALPGRNAVWIEEAPEASPAEAPLPVPPAAPAVPAAVAKLRAVPLEELSLCHMVERFAAALQEYQAAHGSTPASEDHDREQREAILGEALRALSHVTRTGLAEMQGATHTASGAVVSERVRGAA